MENILNINKPKGPSSFAMVAAVRKNTGVKRVGHAGTLDPLASGVLVVAVGREATKKISEIVGKEKEYVADIKLGVSSTTDDAEGLIKNNYELRISNYELIIRNRKVVFFKIPSREKVNAVIKNFIGLINQVPPQYSAMKVGGRRAYKLARQGQEVKLEARPVLVKEIELLEYEYPDLKIRVVCGPGVYIRSLARDLGQALGCGAYMSDLVRTRIGEYRIEDAVDLGNL